MDSMSSRGAELSEYYATHSEFNSDYTGGEPSSTVQDDQHSSVNEDIDRRTIHNVDSELHTDIKVACSRCSHCAPLLKRVEQSILKYEGADHDSSDVGLKHRSTFIDIRNHDQECNCAKRDCKRSLTWGSIMAARDAFWGACDREPLSREQRNKRTIELLCDAHNNWRFTHKEGKDVDPYQRFIFKIGGTVICERAFKYIMFLRCNKAKFRSLKRKVLKDYGCIVELNGDERDEDNDAPEEVPRDCPKFIHACAHIQNSANLAGGLSACEGFDKSVFIPYPDITYFYYEYESYCLQTQIHRKRRAALSTFRLAWLKMSQDLNLKFSGGRGGHDTCSICANARDLLRECDAGSWSPQERDIIMQYRRLHVRQQMNERIYLEANIGQTNHMDPVGQPTSAVAIIDAMTYHRGNTPFEGLENKKDDTDHIGSRLFGAEVHCGPIHGTFLYYVDNMIPGGGNLIVRLMQQAMVDLANLLAKKDDVHGVELCLPHKKITFQFDNCSENKNHVVFTYASLMVQDGLFEEVHINFLIVGHTHCSIDQYFSVIARALNRQVFIASPLGLEEVWSRAFNGDEYGRKNPLLITKINDVFDLKAAFKDIMAPKIVNISIPFCFKFSRFYGKSICQYKQFSTHREWLPRCPSIVRGKSLEDTVFGVGSKIHVHSCDFTGGSSFFNKSLGIDKITTNMMMDPKSKQTIARFGALSSISDRLHTMEAKSLLKMRQRFENMGHAGPPTAAEVTNTIREILVKPRANTSHSVLMFTKDCDTKLLNPALLNYENDHLYLNDMPDLVAMHGESLAAMSIMQQLQPIFTSTGSDLMKAVMNSRPPDNSIDVFAFMRKILLHINSHRKELIKKKKDVVIRGEELQNERRIEDVPDDPSPNDDGDQSGDLSIGIPGASAIARTARRIFADIFEQPKIKWTGRHAIDTRDSLQISNSEVVFYFERLFEPMVVATLRRDLQHVAAKKFELLPMECLTHGARLHIERANERSREMMEMSYDHIKKILTGPKKRYDEGENILANTKRKVATMMKAGDRLRLCEIKGCTYMATLNSECSVCHLHTCDQPSHSDHNCHHGMEQNRPQEAAPQAEEVEVEETVPAAKRPRRRSTEHQSHDETQIAIMHDRIKSLEELVLQLVGKKESSDSGVNRTPVSGPMDAYVHPE